MFCMFVYSYSDVLLPSLVVSYNFFNSLGRLLCLLETSLPGRGLQENIAISILTPLNDSVPLYSTSMFLTRGGSTKLSSFLGMPTKTSPTVELAAILAARLTTGPK
mmetsp:Transcript_7912/g.11643  ORF Transcript_7912/g.11643 Transcript_7912/m.11643 type:complete len:106 (+) Transcript_7912:35-352(+)